MASSTGGRLLRGAIYGGVIGAVIGVALYIVIRGAAARAFNQELPYTSEDVIKNVVVFGGIGLFMGFMWQVGAQPKDKTIEVDPETDRKLREQAAKEAAARK